MKHEIILALLGCEGTLIHENLSTGVMEVDAAAPFLSDAEKQALNRLVCLGTYYQQVLRFAELGDNEPAPGLYIRAFRSGLMEQLKEYHDLVVELEAEILADITKPVSYLQYRLQSLSFTSTLPTLAEVVLQASISPPQCAAALNRLAKHCHGVLLRMCETWMLHGRLIDPFSEFFVARSLTAKANQQKQQLASSEHEPAPTELAFKTEGWIGWASGLWDEAPWDYVDAGFSVRSVSSGRRGKKQRETAREEEQEWHHAFKLRLEALPLKYFPTSLAHKVLFVGKAVRTLRRGVHAQGRAVEGESLKLTDEEIDSFATEFASLRRSESFHLLSLEALVERVHSAIAGRLWHLVMHTAQLPLHLRSIRDFLLLGRGEFWHEFIIQSREMMRLPPNTRSEEVLVNGPLSTALRNCSLDDEALSKRVRPTLTMESFACRQFDTLSGFQLTGIARHDRDTKSVELTAYTPTPPAAARPAGSEQDLLPGEVRRGSELLGARRRSSDMMSTTADHAHGMPATGELSPDSGVFVGGLWTNRKKRIRRAFASSVKFTWEPAGTGEVLPSAADSLSVSLLLHNSRRCPTEVVSRDGVTDTSNCVCLHLAFPSRGGDGPARLRVLASDRSVGYHGNLTSTPHAKPSSSSSAATPASDPSPYRSTPPKEIACVELSQRVLPNAAHWLGVEYNPTGKNAGLVIYLDDPRKTQQPLATVPLVLHQILTLDGGEGGYVGVQACVDGCEAGLASPVNLRITEWSLSVKSSSNASSMVPSIAPSQGLSAMSAQSIDRFLDAQATWDDMHLQYQVDWPLHLIFTQEAMDVYNKLFALLWSIKRTQFELELMWPRLTASRYRNLPPQDNVWLRPLHATHAAMLYLVKNLQTYLQVDVVEAQYSKLAEEIVQQKDYDAVRKAHTQYQAALQKKSHIGTRPLMDGLQRILRLCRQFCALFSNFMNAADIPHSEVEAISNRFQTEASGLFLMLERTDAKELAGRLDFNNWFTHSTRGLTGTG